VFRRYLLPEAEPMKKSIVGLAFILAWLLSAGPSLAEPRTRGGSSLVEGSRAVLAAVVRVADDNARQAADKRPKGDDLTVLYIRAAAEGRPLNCRAKHAAGSFLVGLGLGPGRLHHPAQQSTGEPLLSQGRNRRGTGSTTQGRGPADDAQPTRLDTAFRGFPVR